MSRNIDTFGMTVDELLSLDQAAINSLDERNLSHAVRTLALAANKRVNRLQQYAQKNKRDGKYVEKAGGPGVDFTALYAASERKKVEGSRDYEYGKIRKFGMGRSKITSEKTQDYKDEFTRAANFLRAKSTTVKGAIELRKQKEIALFGETREQAAKRQIKKGMTKKQRQKIRREIQKNFSDLTKDVYSEYNKFKEEEQLEGYYDYQRGKRNLRSLGEKMREKQPRLKDLIDQGVNPEDAKEQIASEARQAVSEENTDVYEEKERQEQKELHDLLSDEDDYMGLFDDENR